MKVYHCANARSLRVIWTAEELGLDLEVHGLQFPPRARDRAYLDVVPTGVIPAFEDGDVHLVESIAICEYLAHRHGGGALTVAADDPAWPDYLQFLHMGEATLVPPLTQMVRYRMLEPKERRLPQAVADAAEVFIDRLKPVSAKLANGDFLAGDRFTLADVSVGYALQLGAMLRLSDQYDPTVAAYHERLRERPGMIRALSRNDVPRTAGG
jgi:glutathione S-transferase